MDSASRRSWAPLTTVTLPEGDSLQQCFGDEREVDPERFLQVLCQKRGKKKFAFELSTEQALLFLRVYRTTANNAYARRVRQLLAQPDVAKVLDPNEPAFLELKVRLNQAPNLKEVDACERKLKDMRGLSPLDHEEAECLRQAIGQKRLKLRMLQLVHSNMPAVTDEALNLASVALRQNLHREAAQLIEKLILTALNQSGTDAGSVPEGLWALIRHELPESVQLSPDGLLRVAMLEGKVEPSLEKLFAVGDPSWIDPEPFIPMNPRYVERHEDLVDSEWHFMLFKTLLSAEPPFGTPSQWAEATTRACLPDAPDAHAARWLRLRDAVRRADRDALLAWCGDAKGPMETAVKMLAGVLTLAEEDPLSLDDKALARREAKLQKLTRSRLVRASSAWPKEAYEALWYAAIALKSALVSACVTLGMKEAPSAVAHRLPKDNFYAYTQLAHSTVRRLTYPRREVEALPDDATVAELAREWFVPELEDENLRRKLIGVLARTPLENRNAAYWQKAAEAAQAGFFPESAETPGKLADSLRNVTLLTHPQDVVFTPWIPFFERIGQQAAKNAKGGKNTKGLRTAVPLPLSLAPDAIRSLAGEGALRAWFALPDGCFAAAVTIPGRTDVEALVSVNTGPAVRRTLAHHNLNPNHYPEVALTALNRPGADDALDTFARTLSCLVSSPPAEELWAEGEPFDLFWRGSSVSTDGTGFELFGFCGARHEDWVPKTLEKQGTHVVTPRALRGDEATAANLFGLAMLIEKDDAGLYATLDPERPYLLSVRESGHPTEGEHTNPPDWVVALGDADPNELCLVDTRVADGELPLGRILPVKPKGRPTALWFIPGGMPIGTPTPANAVLMRLRDAAALDPNAAPFIDAAHLHPLVRWRDGCYRLYEEPAA